MTESISTNHHLIEKLFIYCKSQTLLTCRLVCKQWAEEATRILRKRSTVIAFRAKEDVEEFLIRTHPISQTFAKFLIDIPSNGETYLDILEEIPAVVVDLLECYKDEVTNLKFWYRPQIQVLTPLENTQDADTNEPDEMVNNFIQNQPEVEGQGNSCDILDNDDIVVLSNLQCLQLLSNYVQPTANPDPRQQQIPHRMPRYFTRISTPNLRHLAIQHLYDTDCSSTVVNIINSSLVPLEYFKIPAKLLPSVALHRSISFENLRELDILGIFNGFSCATNETLDSIIKTCGQLEKLGIEFSFRATLPKIQGLFQALSKTLVELKCTIQDRNLLARQILRVDFRFPTMAKLKCLQMRWSNPGLVYYIDRLPMLEELALDTVWTRKIQGNVHPNGQPFEGMEYKQLTSLKLTQVVTLEQIETFSKYFPNLLVLGCSFESNEALRAVYQRMTKLKWLIIERKSNVTEAAGLCGIEDEELAKMNECWSDTNFRNQLGVSVSQVNNKNHLSQLPYIGNLENLETLELCQLGATWCSLVYGVANLTNLKTLVVQSKTFRLSVTGETPNRSTFASPPPIDPTLTQALMNYMGRSLKQLCNLTLWIRHTSERPSVEEISTLEREMAFLDKLNIVNHSLCGI